VDAVESERAEASASMFRIAAAPEVTTADIGSVASVAVLGGDPESYRARSTLNGCARLPA
jgi:hypothetical protein